MWHWATVQKQTIDNHQHWPVGVGDWQHNHHQTCLGKFLEYVFSRYAPRMSFHKNQRSDLNQEVTSPVRWSEIYGVTTTVMLSTVKTVPRDKMLNIISPGFLIILAPAPSSSNSRIFNYLSKSSPPPLSLSLSLSSKVEPTSDAGIKNAGPGNSWICSLSLSLSQC